MAKKRAAFYIDGFNLYHSISNLNDPRLRWLSLANLANLLIPKRDEEVSLVRYFSALAHKRGIDSVKRHEAYLAGLKSEGVDCILGRFKGQPRRCNNCGNTWQHPEEKETDVNIAIHMISDGYQDVYDVCYLVSADTDLVPPIQMIRKNLPQKEIVAVSPPNRPHGQHIKNLAHRSIKLNAELIRRCRLPDKFEYDGKQFSCPQKYL